jgi:hypothetical protein
VRFVVLAALASPLIGCSSVALDERTVFVDPARYDLYDCIQLETARSQATRQLDDLRRLMHKAEMGVGGAVISEMAYRPDYLTAQGRLKAIEVAYEDRRCAAVRLSREPSFARPQPNASPSAPRSKTGIY